MADEASKVTDAFKEIVFGWEHAHRPTEATAEQAARYRAVDRIAKHVLEALRGLS